jgi:very-short-patch-repair endonuclease
MWAILRDRRFIDLKFRRQHPMGPYILDFYCPALKLAVELDGGQHNEPSQKRRDAKRTAWLEKRGIMVIRFWDHDVLGDTESVLEALYQSVTEKQRDARQQARPAVPPHPNPLPEGEGYEPPSPPGRGVGGEGDPPWTDESRATKEEPERPSGVDLVVIDLGWTPQRLAVPAALRWLKPDPTSRIISLIKPHYELSEDEKRTLLIDGRLDPAEAERIFQRVLEQMPSLGATVRATTRSPITGGKSSRRGAGNVEYLALLTR